MREPSVLIVYGTSYGQTAKIARRIAHYLRDTGARVTLVDTDEIPDGLRVADFDGVILGGSILFGRHKKALRRFARANRDALAAVPSAFFSVSGSAASTSAAERAEAGARLDAFTLETGWRPTLCVSLAGAIAYTQYHPLVRLLLRHLMRKEGGPTDVTRDHELTDWGEVHRFADAVAHEFAAHRTPDVAPA